MGGIPFDVIRNGNPKRHYLHIHGNESTARQVLLQHAKTHKGEYFLVIGSKRLVTVGECSIDPNRMFTVEGARKSLERYNSNKSSVHLAAAMALLDRDRSRFLRLVAPPKDGVMIAMHNNSDGYSIADEVPISDRVSMPDKDHPHEFMLATNEADFEAASKGPFNIVLQNTVRDDDGSFSVLSASRGLRYFNIEAANGNFSKQQEMLSFLDGVLG